MFPSRPPSVVLKVDEASIPQLTLSVIALDQGDLVSLLALSTQFTADSIESLLDDSGTTP